MLPEATGPAGGHDAAHTLPAFLPWHREYLDRLEAELQKINPITIQSFGFIIAMSIAYGLSGKLTGILEKTSIQTQGCPIGIILTILCGPGITDNLKQLILVRKISFR